MKSSSKKKSSKQKSKSKSRKCYACGFAGTLLNWHNKSDTHVRHANANALIGIFFFSSACDQFNKQELYIWKECWKCYCVLYNMGW